MKRDDLLNFNFKIYDDSDEKPEIEASDDMLTDASQLKEGMYIYLPVPENFMDEGFQMDYVYLVSEGNDSEG